MSESYELKEGKFNFHRVAPEDKKSDKHPDFYGNGMYEGKEFKVSAWARKSKEGKPYLSCTIQPPRTESTPVTSADIDSFLDAPTTNVFGETVDPINF